MAAHVEFIDENLVFLCDYTLCSTRLLDSLLERNIITRDESAYIKRQPEGYDRNARFYDMLRRKGSEEFSQTVGIMDSKDTKQNCRVISILKRGVLYWPVRLGKECALKIKWWPEEILLANAFYKRKYNGSLLIKKLRRILTTHDSRTAVISHKVVICGFGGVGKTTMARWYAKHYKKCYDHIIWIDCGEGGLLNSFRELSSDLKLELVNQTDLKKIGRQCFRILEDQNCLWIFDNAERYVGIDGIKDVLPRNPHFHSIITSRNREWGSDTGFGKIPHVPLGAFQQDESFKFMITHLKSKSFKNADLKKLCDLLGNLPLALQIAVVTLNRPNINLTYYIDRVESSDHILTMTLEDYEKTINATLKIAFATIEKSGNDSAELAFDILLTFGYIRSDDVPLHFFELVQNRNTWEIEAAMDLLEQYSLVSKKTITDTYDERRVLKVECTIHRLLQQVIRHNGKYSKNDTLRKILQSSADLNYKIKPIQFADEGLQHEFPQLRARLIDQSKLSKLIMSRKFIEACRVSLIIKSTLNCAASTYNHSICIKNCGRIKTAFVYFKHLYHKAIVLSSQVYPDWTTELLPLSAEPTKEVIGSQIFLLHLLQGQFEEAEAIFMVEGHIKLKKSQDSMRCIINAITTKAFGNRGFKLHVDEEAVSLSPNSPCTLEVKFVNCLVHEVISELKELRSLKLINVIFSAKQCDTRSSCILLPVDLDTLIMNFATTDIEYFKDGENELYNHKRLISLSPLENLTVLELNNCSVDITDAMRMVRLKTVTLENVSFIRNGEEMMETIVNEFIEMSGAANAKEVILAGHRIRIHNLASADWTIGHLFLDGVTLGTSRLRVRELEVKNTLLDFSDIPESVVELTIGLGAKVTANRDFSKFFHLPNLKYLNVISTSFHMPMIIGKCPGLIGIRFEEDVDKVQHIHFSAFPDTVSILHLEGVKVTGITLQKHKIHKLVLFAYTIKECKQILTVFQPTHLILFEELIIGQEMEQGLIDMIRYPIESIVIGPIIWSNFQKSQFNTYVDKEGKFYKFESQKGKVISYNEVLIRDF